MSQTPPPNPESPTRARDYFVRHEPGSDRVTLELAQTAPRVPVIGILDHLRSAHNVGSAFRTADGAHIRELFLVGYTPTPPHRHLAKTALGAVDSVPWRHFETTEAAIQAAREMGAQVLALEKTDDSISIWEAELQFPLALIAGNEAEGLSEQTRALCDATVHLPMLGHKNSLNVSVAWGVALYEVLRVFSMESHAETQRRGENTEI